MKIKVISRAVISDKQTIVRLVAFNNRVMYETAFPGGMLTIDAMKHINDDLDNAANTRGLVRVDPYTKKPIAIDKNDGAKGDAR